MTLDTITYLSRQFLVVDYAPVGAIGWQVETVDAQNALPRLFFVDKAGNIKS